MRALISVSDKTGIVEFARELEKLGFEIFSTGGTLRVLEENNIGVKSVSDITKFPECLDGRVKTLHPNIHGAILARRNEKSHIEQLRDLEISEIDLIAVNLYPFRDTISKENVSLTDAIENIDIGGPTMLRSAAKNHEFVIPLCDASDYSDIISELKERGYVSYEKRYELALKVFQHTALYDSTIAAYLRERLVGQLVNENAEENKIMDIMYPKELTLGYEKVQNLRYGENPHQSSSYYRTPISEDTALVKGKQIHGKELSFNNINDMHGAVGCLLEFSEPTAVAVKHANPCGVASGKSIFEAYKKAHDCDPISIFGGIVACNREVDEDTANEMSKIFLEIVVAPSFSKEAKAILMKKKNLRLIEHEALMSGNIRKNNTYDIRAPPTFGRCPFSSSKFAFDATPIRVPTVSNKSTNKNENTITAKSIK